MIGTSGNAAQRKDTTMTKAEFDAAMIKGWEGRDYLSGRLFDDSYQGTGCCAMGAAILGTMSPGAKIVDDGTSTPEYICAVMLVRDMPMFTMDAVTGASDAAGSKDAAIAAVTALVW